jgi:hypothetical protein
VLGVPRAATDEEIAQARRRLSREFHPDVNHSPGAAARFDRVQQAFHLLSDPVARAAYDRTASRPAPAHPAPAPAHPAPASARPAPGTTPEPAAHRVTVRPDSVDFGILGPGRRLAYATVTVTWTGEAPGRVTADTAGAWWVAVGTGPMRSASVEFSLTAWAPERGPGGRLRDVFHVRADGVVLAVALTADLRQESPPPLPADFGLGTLTSVLNRDPGALLSPGWWARAAVAMLVSDLRDLRRRLGRRAPG